MSNYQKHFYIKRSAWILLTLIPFIFSTIVHAENLETDQQQIEEQIPTQVSEPSKQLIYTKAIGHKHIGGSGSGCYTAAKTGTRTEEIQCDGSMIYFPSLGTSACSKCAAGYFGDQSGRGCWTTTTHTVSYTYYDLGCGKSAGQKLGIISVEKSTDEWTKELTLTASYENGEAMGVGSQPYIWNGQKSDQNIFEVTENGLYRFHINAKADTNAGQTPIELQISNIDKTEPIIQDYKLTPEDWTNEGVTFEAIMVTDLQPDGTEGCGLHEYAYSYDGGETWSADNRFSYSENGTYKVMVRDKLENCSTITFTIQNIDVTGPEITKTDYDHTDNIASTTLTVEAVDLQPDESAGAGLHKEPYSYDGGHTWGINSIQAIKKSGIVSLAVRDKLGNITETEVNIQNIDSCGPNISYTLYPSHWTNQYVNVVFSVEDVKEDGTKGIGLPQECYSYDNDGNWCDEDSRMMYENGAFTVYVRDLYGYTNSQYVKVTNIDKVAPAVALTYEICESENGKIAVLHGTASDSESGLYGKPYSWNGEPYCTEDSYQVSENGEYSLTVMDNAGNTATAGITVEGLKRKILKPMIQRVEPTAEQDKKEEADVIEKKLPKLVSSPEIQQTKQISKKAMNLSTRLLILSVVLFLLLLLVYLLFWWYYTVAVYVEEKGKFRFLGREWIHKKDERYQVLISEKIWQKCTTTHMRFKPAPLFVRMHEGEEIFFLFPEEKSRTLVVVKVMETVLL